MKIVAFLQNMWVRDPERMRQAFAKHGPEFRRRMMEYALFAGCLTGRRLKAALGEKWCDAIVWEEASPVITGNARECPSPDAAHIGAVIQSEKPDLVICFTKPAENLIRSLCSCWMIVVPHPACRHAKTVECLRALRETLDGGPALIRDLEKQREQLAGPEAGAPK